MAFPHDGRKIPKGQSGNPNGRPKKLPQIDVLLAEVLGEENKDGITAADMLLRKLRAMAAQGPGTGLAGRPAARTAASNR